MPRSMHSVKRRPSSNLLTRRSPRSPTIIPGSPLADNRAVTDARRAWARVAAPGTGRTKTFRHRPDRPGWAHQDRVRLVVLRVSELDEAGLGPHQPPRSRPVRGPPVLRCASGGHRARLHAGTRDDRFHDVTRLSNAETARLHRGAGDRCARGSERLQPDRAPAGARPAAGAGAGRLVQHVRAIGPRLLRLPDRRLARASSRDGGAFYTERIVRVPGSHLTFEVTYPVPDVAPAPCLSRERLTFGCLCSAVQDHAAGRRSVVAHPARLSRCRLFLKNGVLDSASNRRFVQEQFARFGVAADRLALEGRADHLTFLGAYAAGRRRPRSLPLQRRHDDDGGAVAGGAGAHLRGRSLGVTNQRVAHAQRRTAGVRGRGRRRLRRRGDRSGERPPTRPRGSTSCAARCATGCATAPVCDVRAFAREMERAYVQMWARYSADR